MEKATKYGGAGVVTGTLPSKTLKETALYLSGRYDKGLYGIDRDIAGEATVENFMYRKDLIIASESEEVRKNLEAHGVDIYPRHRLFCGCPHAARLRRRSTNHSRGEYHHRHRLNSYSSYQYPF